jgi:ornithine carbamoyltransferase
VLGMFLDGLVVRNYCGQPYGQARADLLTLAEYSNLPLINALDDKEHPCQVLADILTLIEKYGEDYRRKKIVFTWGYSQYQQSFGIPQSMMVAAAILGMNITYAYPEGFDLDEEYMDFARNANRLSGGTLEYSHDLKEACDGADVIYVKSYRGIRMTPEQYTSISNKVRDQWCVSRQHFDIANPGAYFMNCMPIVRGEQATAEVVDGKNSLIYQEAENRLHIQKAIMATLMQ